MSSVFCCASLPMSVLMVGDRVFTILIPPDEDYVNYGYTTQVY